MMLRKLLCQPNLEFAIYPGHVAKDFLPTFSGHVLCWRERMSVEGWICRIRYIAEFMSDLSTGGREEKLKLKCTM